LFSFGLTSIEIDILLFNFISESILQRREESDDVYEDDGIFIGFRPSLFSIAEFSDPDLISSGVVIFVIGYCSFEAVSVILSMLYPCY